MANAKKHSLVYKNLIDELATAGAKMIVISSWRNDFSAMVNLVLSVPVELAVFAMIKLSQRIAVETAIAKGLDPDNPPSLKKFVTRKI